MIHLHTFTFNPYQENTYLLYTDDGKCIIIDPGMYWPDEKNEFLDFLQNRNLEPVMLLNTHCHIDHVLGNHFIHENFGLIPQFHENEVPILVAVQNYAPQMGFNYDVSPIPLEFLQEAGTIRCGAEELEMIFVPGHSPGHLCFYHRKQGFIIGGDTLFLNSIGRTDLPGGNHEQLLRNIREKLFSLPGETVVYPGHGPHTTIGFEKQNNPFLKG